MQGFSPIWTMVSLSLAFVFVCISSASSASRNGFVEQPVILSLKRALYFSSNSSHGISSASFTHLYYQLPSGTNFFGRASRAGGFPLH